MAREKKRPLHPRRRPCPRCGAEPDEPCTTSVGTTLEDIHCTERVTGRPIESAEPKAKRPQSNLESETQPAVMDPENKTMLADGAEKDTGVPNKYQANEEPETPPQRNEKPLVRDGLSSGDPAATPDGETGGNTEGAPIGVPVEMTVEDEEPQPGGSLDFGDEEYLFIARKEPSTKKPARGGARRNKDRGTDSLPASGSEAGEPSLF